MQIPTKHLLREKNFYVSKFFFCVCLVVCIPPADLSKLAMNTRKFQNGVCLLYFPNCISTCNFWMENLFILMWKRVFRDWRHTLHSIRGITGLIFLKIRTPYRHLFMTVYIPYFLCVFHTQKWIQVQNSILHFYLEFSAEFPVLLLFRCNCGKIERFDY